MHYARRVQTFKQQTVTSRGTRQTRTFAKLVCRVSFTHSPFTTAVLFCAVGFSHCHPTISSSFSRTNFTTLRNLYHHPASPITHMFVCSCIRNKAPRSRTHTHSLTLLKSRGPGAQIVIQRVSVGAFKSSFARPCSPESNFVFCSPALHFRVCCVCWSIASCTRRSATCFRN